MALTRSQQAKQRLRIITKAHESTHKSIHNDFKTVLLRVLARHGAPPVTSLKDWFKLPLAVLEDPELIEARQQFQVAAKLAEEAKHSSVSSLPRVRRRV